MEAEGTIAASTSVSTAWCTESRVSIYLSLHWDNAVMMTSASFPMEFRHHGLRYSVVVRRCVFGVLVANNTEIGFLELRSNAVREAFGEEALIESIAYRRIE